GSLALKIITPSGQVVTNETVGTSSFDTVEFENPAFAAEAQPGRPAQQSREITAEDGLYHYAGVATVLNGESPYVMQLVIDQTASARVLLRTLGFFSAATAVVVWIA